MKMFDTLARVRSCTEHPYYCGHDAEALNLCGEVTIPQETFIQFLTLSLYLYYVVGSCISSATLSSPRCHASRTVGHE